MTPKDYKTLSIASHEIMNRLSFIGSAYQYINARYPESKQFKFWTIMGDSIGELNTLMKRTSICRHCAFPEKNTISLKQLLDNLKTAPNTCLTTCLHPIDIVCHCNKDALINVDSEQFTIALCEIIMNGAEASNFGTIHIDTSIQNNDIHIIISNSGNLPDIQLPQTINQDNNTHYSPDDINILSEAFYTTKPEHFGLGLYIANSVINKHNGTLNISQDDKNTYVHIQLPTVCTLT